MAHEDREKLFEKALTRQLRSVAPGVGGSDLQGNTSGENSGCPDAEILAAYHERSLSPGELASWKSHIVGCARCQEILTQLEITEEIPLGAVEETELLVSQRPQLIAATAASASAPAAPAVRSPAVQSKVQQLPARRKMMWQWVAPAGAIAAMLLVWVGLRETRMAPPLRTSPEMADQKTLPKAQGVPASSAVGQEHASDSEGDQVKRRLNAEEREGKNEGPILTANLPALRKDATRDEAKPQGSPEKKQLDVNGAVVPPSADKADDLSLDGRNFEQLTQLPPGKKEVQSNNRLGGQVGGVLGSVGRARTLQKPSDGLHSGAPQNQNQNAQLQANNADVTVQSQSQAVVVENRVVAAPVPAPPPAPAAAPPAAAPQSADASKQAQAEVNQVTSAQEPSSSAFSDLHDLQSLKLAKVKTENAHYAVVSGGHVIWRVGLAGFIAQSRDAGHTFTQQDSGVKTELVAAAAPSDSVCWVVGRSGTVLRTIDGGAHWTKVVSPIKQNLGGVRAQDADHATIWDVTNRNTFATTDGGTTWTPAPTDQ